MRKGMLFFSQYRTLRRIFLKNLKKYLRFVGPYRPGAFFLQDGVLRPTVWPLLCSDECGPGSGGIGSVGPGGPGPPQIPAGADMCDRCGGIRPGGLERASCLRVPPQFCRDGCMLFYRGGCMLRTFAGLPGRMHAVLPDRTFAVLRGGCTPFCRGERSLFCRTGRIDRNISYLCPGSRPVFLAPHPLRCTPLSAHRDACPA